MKPTHIETLADGTWLAELRPSGSARTTAEPLPIRVIDYEIDDGRPNDTSYRLFTTLLDPEVAPAVDLAVAYAERWEIESAFDELKTHQRGARTVLRSKSPGLVLQEIWGHLCCHFAIRTLMWEAAGHARVDPDRVSFVTALRIARRSIPAARERSVVVKPTVHGGHHRGRLLTLSIVAAVGDDQVHRHAGCCGCHAEGDHSNGGRLGREDPAYGPRTAGVPPSGDHDSWRAATSGSRSASTPTTA